jgi:hypothetical protein
VALQSTAVAVGGKQATLLPVVHGIDTITLPTFDNHGGTNVLQGVTIYFYASVNVTTADGSNVVLTAKSGNKAVSIDVDPVSGFTNGAAALNTFPSEPLQLAAPQTVAANAHVSYPTPFSAAANAGANPVIDVNGATIASGTGSGPIMFTSPVQTHLRGAVLNISNPGSGYIDGTGTFTLTGFKPRVDFNNATLTNAETFKGTETIQAEITYTYSTPEPATMGLIGSALVSIAMLRKRLAR